MFLPSDCWGCVFNFCSNHEAEQILLSLRLVSKSIHQDVQDHGLFLRDLLVSEAWLLTRWRTCFRRVVLNGKVEVNLSMVEEIVMAKDSLEGLFPGDLKVLRLDDRVKTVDLLKIPHGLRVLEMPKLCLDENNVLQLPRGLEKLSIGFSGDSTACFGCFAHMKDLSLYDAGKLQHLIDLPRGLSKLCLLFARLNLKRFSLPNSLVHLDCLDIDLKDTLPSLRNLRYLVNNYVYENLPHSLRELSVYKPLEQVPQNWCLSKLTIVTLVYDGNGSDLINLPKSLTDLYLVCNEEIVDLSSLHHLSNLEQLTLEDDGNTMVSFEFLKKLELKYFSYFTYKRKLSSEDMRCIQPEPIRIIDMSNVIFTDVDFVFDERPNLIVMNLEGNYFQDRQLKRKIENLPRISLGQKKTSFKVM